MIQTDIIVIGGGAAGLMAAITAAGHGARTVIIEHMDRVGKKILATGNGKCNYTNALQGISYYRGENPAFVLPVFEQFGFEDTVSFFKELGIWPKERNGYYYPASEQASSVLDVLRMEAEYRGVKIVTSCEIKRLEKRQEGREKRYMIQANCDTFSCEKIIFAPGLLASPKTGSDGSAFPYIERLGHHFIDIVPALVQLQGKQAFFKALAGIRAESRVDLHIKNEQIQSETGELQLTDYGISGIPVFQISRYATKALLHKQPVYALLNFAHRMTAEELMELLVKRFTVNAHGKTASEAMVGFLNKKLSDVLLKEAGISLHVPAMEVERRQLARLRELIQGLRVDIIGSKNFDAAQVCAGGVDTREIDNRTLESKLAEGVYFAGEVIDIDGTCGGYNLQWAWSSGYVAGAHAAEGISRGNRQAAGKKAGKRK